MKKITTQEKVNDTTKAAAPHMKLSAGAVKATVWNNIVKKENHESEYSTITLERVYKDKEEEWQSTNILRVADIPKAIALLQKTYDTLVVKEIAQS